MELHAADLRNKPGSAFRLTDAAAPNPLCVVTRYQDLTHFVRVLDACGYPHHVSGDRPVALAQ